MSRDWILGILTLTFLFCFCATTGTGNHLGPDHCLIHRIDVIPCSRWNKRTELPDQNQYGLYNTKFYNGGHNRKPICKLRRKEHKVKNISKIGNAMPIFSPGFTLNQDYGNQTFMDFNIQCGKGKIVYLNITEINLQEKSCPDPRNNHEKVCVDYLQVRSKYGNRVYEACGKDASPLRDLQEPDSIRLIFRTSWKKSYHGFRGIAVCFDPDVANSPGCTSSGGTRKKRQNLETLEESDTERRRLDQSDLTLEGILPKRLQLSAEEDRHFASITRSLLSQVRESEEDRLSKEFLNPPARIYDDYDDDEEEEAEQTATRGTPSPRLTLPPILFPKLTLPPTSFPRPTRPPIKILPPTESIGPWRPPELLRREKRRAPSFSSSTAKLALQHENDCNPLLRASAGAVILKLETDNPKRLQSLRESFSDPHELLLNKEDELAF